MDEPHFPLLHEATLFAVKKHAGQDRDGQAPLPYANHLFEVVWNLRYIGGVIDEEVLCAGMLHDVIEECRVKPDALTQRFGRRVSDLVVEMTRSEPTKEESKGLAESAIWQLRSLMLLHDIQEMKTPDARRIKLADRLSNLRESMRTRTRAKHERYVGQTRDILAIIDRKVSPPLWDAIANLLPEQSS